MEAERFVQAQGGGFVLEELAGDVSSSEGDSAPMDVEQGLGLFDSAEDSALLDEVVAMAHEERRRPSNRTP